MPLTMGDGHAQLFISRLPCLDALFPQQLYPFSYVQANHRIFLQVGRRVFAGSSWPWAAGEQYPALAWLTIERIKPLADTGAVCQYLSCPPVQHIFELVKDYQSWIGGCIQQKKKGYRLVLWCETA